MIGLRVVLVALGDIVGLVLLSQGFVVVGALLLTMAVVRTVLIVRWRHSINERVARRRAARAGLDRGQGA